MKQEKKENKFLIQVKEKTTLARDWALEHQKIVWPVVLILCVCLTIVIAVSVGNKQKVTEETATETETASETDAIPVPDAAFEVNAYPDINTLINNFYQARVDGDIDAIGTMVNPVGTSYAIKATEISKYWEGVISIEVYTKPGPIADSFLAFTYSEVKLVGYDNQVPCLETLYICKNEDGSYYINEEEEQPQNVADYIAAIGLQDDTIDLNNKVTVEYNELLANDPNFATYCANLSSQVTVDIGQAVAESQAQETEAAAETPAETEATEPLAEEVTAEPAPQNVNKIVQATDVVNIRSSDSETADKVGKAQIGDKFTLLEEKANGWSKIDYNGAEAFVKTEFLAATDETTTATETNDSAAITTNGTVTAKTTVNIRATESETGEKLGVVYAGEKLPLIQDQADGWCKIKYNDKVGYVKSEYVDK